MQDIPPIEQPPSLSRGCKVVAFIIALSLWILPVVIALLFWYEYDELLISVGIFLFLQFVSGVLSSKMRTHSLPFDQREISYTTYEIVSWYISKHIC